MGESRTRGDGFDNSEIAQCLVALRTSLHPSTSDRVCPTIERFEGFLAAAVVRRLRGVDAATVNSFIRCRVSCGAEPSVATMHNRRSSLRLLFRTARGLGLVDGDPTLDVVLPPRSSRAARPLTDEEVAVCRDVARWSFTGDRTAAVWALAEATARGAELPRVRAADVETAASRVWLAGGTRVQPRWGLLSEWGAGVLRDRSLDMGDGDSSLVFDGDPLSDAARVSASAAISAVLVRAGLARERDVRPGSIAAWAGRRQFDATGDLAVTSRLLGMRSLDHTARTICWDWDA